MISNRQQPKLREMDYCLFLWISGCWCWCVCGFAERNPRGLLCPARVRASSMLRAGSARLARLILLSLRGLKKPEKANGLACLGNRATLPA